MTTFAKTKRCSKCGLNKAREQFYARQKDMPRSASSECKECKKRATDERAWEKARKQVRISA